VIMYIIEFKFILNYKILIIFNVFLLIIICNGIVLIPLDELYLFRNLQ